MLAETWHLQTSSFHFLTGKAIVTLEDLWWIMRLLIHGEWVIYDLDHGLVVI